MLAQIIVDEMRIMRVNIFRLAVHELIGNKWFLPGALEDFELETKWTHILSARLLAHRNFVAALLL